jgi:hypothetical protein
LGSGDGEKQALPYTDIEDPQSLNKYQYCFNNPLRYIDPDGHDGGCAVTAGRIIWTGAKISNPAGWAIIATEGALITFKLLTNETNQTDGDGSCPSADRLIKAYQKEQQAKIDAVKKAENAQQEGNSSTNSSAAREQEHSNGEKLDRRGPNGGQRNPADQRRLDNQRQLRNERRDNRSRAAVGQKPTGIGSHRNHEDADKGPGGVRRTRHGTRNRSNKTDDHTGEGPHHRDNSQGGRRNN